MSRRWLPVSATKSLTPSVDTAQGALRVLAAGTPAWLALVADMLAWPTTTSAAAPLTRGRELNMSSRWAAVSEMNSREPLTARPTGLHRLLADWGEGHRAVVMPAWPTTTLAAAWLAEGMELKMSTRRLSVSATNSLVPSLTTPVGPRREEASGVYPKGTGLGWFPVMSVWPITTLAEALLEVGMVLKMRTRLLTESAMKSLPPALDAPEGKHRQLAAGLPPWLQEVPDPLTCPTMTSAEA